MDSVVRLERRSRIGLAGCLGACLSWAGPGIAQDAGDDLDRYLAVGAYYVVTDSGRPTDDGFGGNVGYALRLWQPVWAEFRGFYEILETGIPAASDFYRYGLGVDFLMPFGDEAGSHPLVFLGGGAVHDDVVPDDRDSTEAYFNAGAGWRTAPLERWNVRLRFDARYAYDSFETGYGDILAGVTLEILPRRDRIIERATETVKIVEVPKEVVREVRVPAQVVDTDGDGIPDEQDRCPDTLAGAKVGPDGCVRAPQVVTLPNIEFEFASGTLAPNGRTQLLPVVRFLKDQPEVSLDIWGHTDWVGSQTYNQPLSEKRARAVLEFLVGHGIAMERLTSAGFGEMRPVASNETEEGRARNRRVELNIRTTAPPPSGR